MKTVTLKLLRLTKRLLDVSSRPRTTHNHISLFFQKKVAVTRITLLPMKHSEHPIEISLRTYFFTPSCPLIFLHPLLPVTFPKHLLVLALHPQYPIPPSPIAGDTRVRQ